MLSIKDFRNEFSRTLNFNVVFFFLQTFPSTIVILKYNFNTKQRFMFSYTSLKSTKPQISLASHIHVIAPAWQCNQPTKYEHSLLLNHSQILHSLPDL